MKCFRAWVCLLLCVVVTLSGCKSRNSDPVYEPEDREGTTKRIQESVLTTVEEAYIQTGCIYFSPDLTDYRSIFLDFISLMETDDTGLVFDHSSVAASLCGYSIRLSTPLDAWGNEMTLWVEMPDVDAGHYVLSLASSGPDGEQQYLGSYDNTSGEAADDIFCYVDGSADEP